MCKLCYIKQVVRNPAHNLSHLVITVIGVGQLLQMGICIRSHGRFYFRPHHMPYIRHIIGSYSVHNAQNKINSAEYQHGTDRQCRQVTDSFIGNVTHYQRQHQFADSRKRCAEQIQRYRFYIRFIIRKKPLQKLCCFIFSRIHVSPHKYLVIL